MHNVLYADENIIFIIKNVIFLNNTVNLEIKEEQAWFEANHSLLNLIKTSCLIFHRRRLLPLVLPSFVVNENVVNRVGNCTFLGIMVNYHINFKSHVELLLVS